MTGCPCWLISGMAGTGWPGGMTAPIAAGGAAGRDVPQPASPSVAGAGTSRGRGGARVPAVSPGSMPDGWADLTRCMAGSR